MITSRLFVLTLPLVLACCARSGETVRTTVPAQAAAGEGKTKTTERPDLKKHFDAVSADGAFVLYDLKGNKAIRYNPDRLRQRFLPASTYKIFNSLVALDLGAVADETTIVPWDSVDRGSAAWNESQGIDRAFQRSTVWVYQELARRIGPKRMQLYLKSEGYGNVDMSGGIDKFWLTGGLRISADEQIEFLKRLYHGTLGFSDRSMGIVRKLMVMESHPGYILRGKTGWAQDESGNIGWLVGWVERDGNVYFYAMNISSADPEFPMIKARRDITFGILRELGVLPEKTE